MRDDEWTKHSLDFAVAIIKWQKVLTFKQNRV